MSSTRLPVVTRASAAAEIEAAYRWYERERQGLGEEFLQAVTDLAASIAEYPERFPVIHRDIRRALLKRFPYGIFYRLKANQVIVVACFIPRGIPKNGNRGTNADVLRDSLAGTSNVPVSLSPRTEEVVWTTTPPPATPNYPTTFVATIEPRC